MKEFLKEDYGKFKDIMKNTYETVFAGKEAKSGFNQFDCVILLTFSIALDIINKKLKDCMEDK